MKKMKVVGTLAAVSITATTILSGSPTLLYAQEKNSTQNGLKTEVKNIEKEALSGDCGATENDKVTSKLVDENDDGKYTLIIEGSGEMADYGYDDNTRPWYEQRKNIDKIIVKDGVKKIGNWAFHGCSNVESIELSENIETIGNSAFQGLKNLTGEFHIGGKLTYFGQDALYATSISEYTIDENNSSYKLKDGILYTSDYKTIVNCLPTKTGEFKSSWLDGVEVIASSAFRNCSNLKSNNFIIPNSVKKIGDTSFQNCSGLTGNLVIPNSVQNSIGSYAFSGSGFNGELTIGSGITDIGTGAFTNCKFNTVPDFGENILTIGEIAFQNCTNMKGNLVIPKTVKSIGKSAFENCSSLTGDLVIPDSVQGAIGEKTFKQCGFDGDIIIGNGVESIELEAFYGCNKAKSLVLGNKITKIGEKAFYKCEGLSSNLVIPNSVTDIERWAFYGCSGFDGNLELSKNLKSIGLQAFFNCGFTGTVIIPEGIKEIPTSAFWGFNATSFIVPNTVTKFGVTAIDYSDSNCIIYFDNEQQIKGMPTSDGRYSPYAVTNGGVFLPDTKFVQGELASPIKDGYVFAAWYDNSNFTGKPVTKPKNQTTYYAKWTESRFNVDNTFDLGTSNYGELTPQVFDTKVEVKSVISNNEEIISVEIDDSDKNKVIITPNRDLTAGTYKEKIFVTTEDEANHIVEVSLTVEKAEPAYEKPSKLTATYGEKLSDIIIPAADNGTFTWNNPNEEVGNVGQKSFKATFTPKDTNNYKTVELEIPVTVKKADNFIKSMSIKPWTYGEYDKLANKPGAIAKFGEVKFAYSDKKDGEYTEKVPENAGIWYVKAYVEGTENYSDASGILEFEISKAVPSYEKPSNLSAVEGQTLADVVLPNGFTWQDVTTTPVGSYGINSFFVTFTPEDTTNYEVVKNIPVQIVVNPKMETINTMPEIIANDVTLTVGDEFDPLANVTAKDAEDGEIVLTKENIVSNDVDTNNVGTYHVTYKVADKDGATVTKIITVTVNLKMETINAVPEIAASDVTLTVGDEFDPLANVTAKDVEDGEIVLTKENIVSNDVDTSKEGTYHVTYKVTDSQGASATKTITVTVNPKMEAINEVPEIAANDVTLTVGDEFDPLANVTAKDAEDGEIVLTKENIVSNDVDTSKAGTYHVTYKVTDSQGASTEITITVTVEDKGTEKPDVPITPEKPSDPDISDKPADTNTTEKTDGSKTSVKTNTSTEESKAPETGKESNMMLYGWGLLLSALGISGIVFAKRRRSR